MSKYRIYIDKRWNLDSLTVFSRTYEQTYAFYVVLSALKPDPEESRLFESLPWRGGYSAVNFYGGLRRTVPPERRPRIVAIRYSSPGYIDLALSIAAAIAISRGVRHIAATIRECNATYNEVMRDVSRRKLGRIRVRAAELELEQKRLRIVKKHTYTISQLIQFRGIDQLDAMTQNPYISLKILLSLYRRTRILAEFVKAEKVRFRSSEEE